jgi:hypothetical protein
MYQYWLRKIGYVAFVFCIGMGSARAKAEDRLSTVDLNINTIYLSPGQEQWVNLGGWHFVKNLFINAHGNYGDAQFEVFANGDRKGTVYAPGRDPQYTVTLNESAQWVLLRHTGGDTAVITKIWAVMSERYLPPTPETENPPPVIVPPPPVEYPVGNRASELSMATIRLVDDLQGYANYGEYGQYLLPIKKAAARSYAAAQARGAISAVVHELLIVLKKQIEFAEDFLNVTFERERAFELAVRMKTIRESLDAELH